MKQNQPTNKEIKEERNGKRRERNSTIMRTPYPWLIQPFSQVRRCRAPAL
jgi:hypothetical protein